MRSVVSGQRSEVSSHCYWPVSTVDEKRSLTDCLSVVRETVPSLTSDMGKKTVSVLAHSFLLPQRANSEYILSIYPLRYSRS